MFSSKTAVSILSVNLVSCYYVFVLRNGSEDCSHSYIHVYTCIAFEKFYGEKPPIPSQHLREMLRLILKENSFQFNGKNYLQTHGTAMGTKMAVAFANIFMSAVETRLISQSPTQPLVWKRYIDDIFSLWDKNKEEIGSFIELANNHHPTIKFTANISETEITFLDTCIYKGDRFQKESILDVKTHFKPTETFQYTHFFLLPPFRGQDRIYQG